MELRASAVTFMQKPQKAAVINRATRRRPLGFLTAATSTCFLFAAGCAAPSSGSESDALSPEEFAAAQGQLEQLLPDLEKSAVGSVDLSVRTLREVSCIPVASMEHQEKTSWHGVLVGLPTEAAVANAALDAIAVNLRSDGWTLIEEAITPEVEIGAVRILSFKKGPFNLRARYERGYPNLVEVFASTDCIEHPEEHQMLRSPLDPDYGNSSQYYPDGA